MFSFTASFRGEHVFIGTTEVYLSNQILSEYLNTNYVQEAKEVLVLLNRVHLEDSDFCPSQIPEILKSVNSRITSLPPYSSLYTAQQLNQKMELLACRYPEGADSANQYLEEYRQFLSSYIWLKEVFSPILVNLTNSSFPQEPILMHDLEIALKKCNAPILECNIQSFGCHILQSNQGERILCKKIGFSDLNSFLYYDFFRGLRHGRLPKKCNVCGKFFLLQNGEFQEFCSRPLLQKPYSTCIDIGTKKLTDDSCRNHPAWKAFNRAYRTHYSQYAEKKITREEFEIWVRNASRVRDQAVQQSLSV